MSARRRDLRRSSTPGLQRAREADGNFRKHQLDSYEQHPLAEDPYDAPAESRRADQFEVLISTVSTASSPGHPVGLRAAVNVIGR